MSNYLAIATVSASLRKLLFDIIQSDISGAQVTTVSPNLTGTGGVPTKGANIYLYKVSPNAALSNIDLPTRNRAGDVITKPQVALNLDYLISFYGSDVQLEPQQLLGITTRALHSKPQINQSMINSAITDPAYSTFLGNSDLAQYIETIKFSPVDMSIEEMSKLWSVFFQTSYALSIAYRASVVLIEGKATPNPPLPVRDYSLMTFPTNKPEIESIHALPNANSFMVIGGQARISGTNLLADGVQMQLEIGGVRVTPTNMGVHKIDFTLPAGLNAGTQGAQIHHAFMQGNPPEPHRALSSNLSAFVLHPFISKQGSNYEITVSNVQGTGSNPRTAEIKVKVIPPAKDTQRLTIELIDKTLEQIRSYNSITNNEANAEITYAVSNIPAGSYLLRVRVDGSDSGFDFNNSNQPIAPEVTIT